MVLRILLPCFKPDGLQKGIHIGDILPFRNTAKSDFFPYFGRELEAEKLYETIACRLF
jgi:hypothetical protein